MASSALVRSAARATVSASTKVLRQPHQEQRRGFLDYLTKYPDTVRSSVWCRSGTRRPEIEHTTSRCVAVVAFRFSISHRYLAVTVIMFY